MSKHRFRPRFRGVAIAAIGVGGSLAAITAIAAGLVLLPIITGAIGVAIGSAYLASPVWRLAVTADETGLVVAGPDRQRFALAWADIARVVASPTTRTCFVDGGTPEKSLVVPGQGANAPYDLEDKHALYDAIMAHVPADKVRIVDTLESAPRDT
ncbi:MAG TPA: hypothetical protein VGO00_14210 [Kofleriaceae bacterium]|nr:hypothetical protein [Kofleriaceae bacterium]